MSIFDRTQILGPDGKARIIGGAGILGGPPLPAVVEPPIEQFSSVKIAWESTFGIGGATASDEDVTTWTDRIAGEVLTSTVLAPKLLEGAYTRTGYPVIDFTGKVATATDLVCDLSTPCDTTSEDVHIYIVGTWPEAQQGGTDTQRVIARVRFNPGSNNYYVTDCIQDLGAGGPYEGVAGGPAHSSGAPSTTCNLSKTRGGWLRITHDNNTSRIVTSDDGTSFTQAYAATEIDRITIGDDSSGRVAQYIHAVYIVQGDSELAEIEAFIEDKWQVESYDGGSFPLFGEDAADCLELHAADLSAAGDGNTIAADWVDRQGGRTFTSGGSAIWHEDWDGKGEPAVETLLNDVNSVFESAAAIFSQPGTIIVEAAPTSNANSSTLIFVGPKQADNHNVWIIMGSQVESRNGALSDDGGAAFPTTGQITAWRTLRGSGWRCDGPRLLCGVIDGVDSRAYRDGLHETEGDGGAFEMPEGFAVANYSNSEFPIATRWIGVWPIALTHEQILQVVKYRGIV